MRLWRLTKGDDALRIEVHASADGATAALDRLVAMSAATTTVEVPYERFPGALGQVAVQIRNAELHDVIWVFHDLCLRVRWQGASPDARPQCQAVQAFAASHVVDAAPNLTVDSIEVQPVRVAVGDRVHVNARVSPAIDDARIISDFHFDMEALSQVKVDTTSLVAEAMKPGITAIEFVVADRSTLASASALISVEIADREWAGVHP